MIVWVPDAKTSVTDDRELTIPKVLEILNILLEQMFYFWALFGLQQGYHLLDLLIAVYIYKVKVPIKYQFKTNLYKWVNMNQFTNGYRPWVFIDTKHDFRKVMSRRPHWGDLFLCSARIHSVWLEYRLSNVFYFTSDLQHEEKFALWYIPIRFRRVMCHN